MWDELLKVLLDCLEGRRSHAAWGEWWETHGARVEAECGRFVYLRLKLRGLGVAHVILEEHGIPMEWCREYCPYCGEPTLIAMPGKTTVAELREFAEKCRMRGTDEMVEDDWIHPGVYCATHGALVASEVVGRMGEVEL